MSENVRKCPTLENAFAPKLRPRKQLRFSCEAGSDIRAAAGTDSAIAFDFEAGRMPLTSRKSADIKPLSIPIASGRMKSDFHDCHAPYGRRTPGRSRCRGALSFVGTTGPFRLLRLMQRLVSADFT